MTATLPETLDELLLGVAHIGILTDDLEAQVRRFQTLFAVPDNAIQWSENPSARFAFLTAGGMPYELIEPLAELTCERMRLTNRGLNHLCYEVRDIDAAVARMAEKGVRLGHVTPDGVADAPDRRMAYFNPEDTAGVLIEFLEFS